MHKKDSPRDKINYRPVTVLSAVGKVFEKVLGKQITAFMEPRLYNNLTAYRRSNSCETTLLQLVEDWKTMLDSGKVVGLLSTDLSKAFDSLHPPLLLAKLKASDFSENALKLMKSYFLERKNRVRMRTGDISDWMESTRGCPQGSNFGPLLWNIFQNDLVTRSNDGDLTMYADDHQLYASGDNGEGRCLSEWYEDNQLKCNHSKYQVMAMGSKCKNQTMYIDVKDRRVEATSNINLLGLNIDMNLTFTDHIKNVCTKGSRKVGVLSRFKNMILTRAKLTIYKSFILPQLTYCHIVWQFCRASDNRKLERIQERAVRAIYCDKNSNYKELLERAKLPTLSNRRYQDVAILMYKVKNNLVPSYITIFFVKNDNAYNLRNSNDFQIPRFNTITYGRHSIKYMGPYIWSKISKEIKTAPSLNAFKNQVRDLDLERIISEKCNNCYLCNN